MLNQDALKIFHLNKQSLIGPSLWRQARLDQNDIARFHASATIAEKKKLSMQSRLVDSTSRSNDWIMEIYEAKYDFCDGCGESLLNFKKGEKFLVTNKPDGGWWAAQNLSSNEIGYIPSAYVEVKDVNFFCFPFYLYLWIFLKRLLSLQEILVCLKSKLKISPTMFFAVVVTQTLGSFQLRGEDRNAQLHFPLAGILLHPR